MNNSNNNNTSTKAKREKKMIVKDVAKVLNSREGGVSKQLISSNTYLRAILDPFNTHGVRIPDLVTVPSSTFAIVDRRVLSVNSLGTAGIVYGLYPLDSQDAVGTLVPIAFTTTSEARKSIESRRESLRKDIRVSDAAKNRRSVDSDPKTSQPEIVLRQSAPLNIKRLGKKSVQCSLRRNEVDFSAINVDSYCVGSTLTSGATDEDLFALVSGVRANPIFFDQWNADDPTIPALYQQVRLVSAGVAINYTGGLTDAKGTMTLASVPRNSALRAKANVNAAISIGEVQQLPGARVIPLNDLKGGTALYMPSDNLCLSYTDEQIVYFYDSSTDDWPNQVFDGEIWCIIDGATSGVHVQVTGTFNYEGIPAFSDVDLVSTEASLSDPIGLSQAFNILEKVPNVMNSTNRALGLVTGKTQIEPKGGLNASSLHQTSIERNAGLKKQDSVTDRILGTIGRVGGDLVNTGIEAIPGLVAKFLM